MSRYKRLANLWIFVSFLNAMTAAYYLLSDDWVTVGFFAVMMVLWLVVARIYATLAMREKRDDERRTSN